MKWNLRLLKEASNIVAPGHGTCFNTQRCRISAAERHPARFHGTEPFDIETGLPSKPRVKANYTDIFSTVMRKLGDRDEKVVAITAAMTDGTGLNVFIICSRVVSLMLELRRNMQYNRR